MKIQSISDIITNSSSEVFMIYTKEGIQLFKDIVSTLIKDDFDNHFHLELIICTYDSCDNYADRSIYDKDLSFEDWCLKHDETSDEGYPYVEGFKIIAKNPEDKEAAMKLNKIYSIFETTSRYC